MYMPEADMKHTHRKYRLFLASAKEELFNKCLSEGKKLQKINLEKIQS
jgi:hypothetical protein